MVKQLIKELEFIENRLDRVNGYIGGKDMFCLYCECSKYNGKEGLVHKDDCLLKKLRELIKKLKT